MKRIAAVFLYLFCASAIAASPVEQQVSDITKTPGVSVVHLWAPWCSNCLAELKSGGWPKMIKDNPETQFVFVSIWNAGDDGRAMLKRHEIGDQPNVTIIADPGPRRGEGKLTRFLDLPVTWIPTTWVFKGGDLRYALNYGEVRFDVLQQFLTDSLSEWSHKSEATAPTPAP
jgi:thiol-disulfide isomerase/thioredoxin